MGAGAGEEGAEHPRIRIRGAGRRREFREELAEDVRRGLARPPRSLPPKYFYDARGSRLFEEITRLPEYYLTRAEREILEAWAPELVGEIRPEALVEFGSGSSEKTRILLDAMAEVGCLRGYGPVDVSGEALEEAARGLVQRYPTLEVRGLVADFHEDLPLPFDGRPRLVAFLGSTIGNMEAAEAEEFLARVAGRLGPEDRFLVGFDLVKKAERLEAAYDDPAGVTAEFNRNVLRVMNRELDADFDPDAFRHEAVWNPERARMELYLVSGRSQRVRFRALDLEIEIARGERILTELSHKYTRPAVEGLLAAAGLALEAWRTDGAGDFALALSGV